ncbi:MAG: hypothetical protein IJW37_03825 [Lachnospiraceae bacterium]|nr:hypothetical protein [Lachnospiraceae bacterium]
MKKTIFFLLLAAAFTFAGCSEAPANNTTNDAQNTPTTGPQETNIETTPTATPATPTPAPTATPAPTTAPTPTEPLVVFDRERTYPDNTVQTMARDYLFDNPAPKGTVVDFTYETRNHRSDDGKTYQKTALVYLPPCYDENDTETKYNVLYLMHGGGDSPEWFLGKKGTLKVFNRMMDYMIDSGEIEPMIICAVSYYNEYSGDATKNCIDFHLELMNDLIPVFETTYRTHAEDVTPEGLAASRTHRAFGGFSMGAVTTWSVFENCLDEFAYFIPMSGDCWALGMTAGNSKAVQTAQHLADKVAESGKTAEDFFIYSGCGTTDIANPNLTPQINQMKTLTDTFLYCDNFANGNLYQCVVPGGHDVLTVNQILYNGIPKLFH